MFLMMWWLTKNLFSFFSKLTLFCNDFLTLWVVSESCLLVFSSYLIFFFLKWRLSVCIFLQTHNWQALLFEFCSFLYFNLTEILLFIVSCKHLFFSFSNVFFLNIYLMQGSYIFTISYSAAGNLIMKQNFKVYVSISAAGLSWRAKMIPCLRQLMAIYFPSITWPMGDAQRACLLAGQTNVNIPRLI